MMITKLLTNSLSLVLDPLIDDSQAAFIKGRLIGDNIVCAHEILHQVRLSKQKGLLLKLDFEKAFDKVNWDFLIEVLVHFLLIGLEIFCKVVELVYLLMVN
jgi:hypothetical protein